MKFLAAILLMCFFASLAEADDLSALRVTEEERSKIQALVEQADFEDLAPLVFAIGPPGDSANFTVNPAFDRLVRGSGLGGFMMNSYHYHQVDGSSDVANLENIRRFNNELRTSAPDRILGLPPLMMVDFESYEFSSLQKLRVVPHMPSAQSLGAIRDYELIRAAGNSSGYVLKRLGFSALLGPVLDLQKPGERNDFSSMHTRSISSDRNILINAASHFMFGMNETGILTFGKHLPGIGGVVVNPHLPKSKRTDISRVTSPADVFLADLEPFRAFLPYLDGYMTSHVAIESLGRNLPVTVDTAFIEPFIRSPDAVKGFPEFQGLGAADHLIVTDDVSDMGSLLLYQERAGLSWPSLSVKMIEAGHDLILVSHLAQVSRTPRTKNGGDFGPDALLESIQEIASFAQEDRDFGIRLRQSAVRVLVAKFKAHRAFDPEYELSSSLPDASSFEVSRFGQNGLFSEGAEIDLADIEKRLTDAAFTHISGPGYVAQDYFDGSKKVCVAANKAQVPRYQQLLKNEVQVSIYEMSATRGKPSDFERQKRELDDFASDCDVLFVEVISRENTDILDALRLSGHTSKTIALVHTSVLSIEKANFGRMRTFGSFTRHPKAFDTNVSFILGKIAPNPTENVPVPVGSRQVSTPKIALPDTKSFQSLLSRGAPVASQQREKIQELRNLVQEKESLITDLKVKNSQLSTAAKKSQLFSRVSVEKFLEGNEQTASWVIPSRGEGREWKDEAENLGFDLQVVEGKIEDGFLTLNEVAGLVTDLGSKETAELMYLMDVKKQSRWMSQGPIILMIAAVCFFVAGLFLFLRAVRRMRRKRTILNVLIASPNATLLLAISIFASIAVLLLVPHSQVRASVAYYIDIYSDLKQGSEDG